MLAAFLAVATVQLALFLLLFGTAYLDPGSGEAGDDRDDHPVAA